MIKLFGREEGWDAVQEILSKVEAEEVKGTIGVVTLTEVYYKYFDDGYFVKYRSFMP